MSDYMDDDYEEKDISSPDVVDKYKAASDVANRVMLQVLENIHAGKSVHDLCALGDQLITEICANTYKKVKPNNKGIAFPTCISMNNCAGHLSPLPEDPQILLKDGDLVKVDLGVHFDGYSAQVAHTWIVGAGNSQTPITGRIADVICAAYFATECAVKLLRPGRTNTDVTNIIQKVAETFHVRPVEAVLSHQVKQNVLDGNRVIINRREVDQNVDEFQFEVNQCFCLDIMMSTGEGKPKEIESRTTVYKRAVDRKYILKLQASRTLFSEITSKFPNMAFSLRNLKDPKRRLGIVEIVKHELVEPYPVLWEKEGEYIAQFKTTVLIHANNTEKLAASFPLPLVTSQYSIDGVPEIAEVMALSTNRKKKKKKPAKSKAGGQNTEEAAPEDDKMDTQ